MNDIRQAVALDDWRICLGFIECFFGSISILWSPENLRIRSVLRNIYAI